MKTRRISDEILDHLDPQDPDAIQSRRDLRKFNFIQGNYRWFAKCLRESLSRCPNAHIVEIGAGDGGLGAYLDRQKVINDEVRVTGIDLAPRPDAWPCSWNWIQGSVFEVNLGTPATHIIASLTLHHFYHEELKNLNRLIGPDTVGIFASETFRSRIAMGLLPLARLMGINYVTRYDARVSLEAGFRDMELPEQLGLPEPWEVVVNTSPLGSYRMDARR